MDQGGEEEDGEFTFLPGARTPSLPVEERSKRTWFKRLKGCIHDASDLQCQMSWLAPFIGIALLLGVILLPAVALCGVDNGWAVSEGSEFHMHIGWAKGCAAGFDEIIYKNVSGHGIVWVPCSKDSLQYSNCMKCSSHLVHEILLDSGSETLGFLFPLVYAFCLFLPIVFCMALPRACAWGCVAMFGRSWKCDGAWWGHVTGLCLVLMVQTMWIALGVSIIVLSIFFVKDIEIEVGKRSTAVVSVICSSAGTVCSEVKTLKECDDNCVLGGQATVNCASVDIRDMCWLELSHIGCDEAGALCKLNHSWGFGAAMSSGAILIVSAIMLAYLLWRTFQAEE